MRHALRLKLRYLSIGLCIIAALLIVRLYFVQVVDGEEYALKGERQYVQSGRQLYDRGSVFFTRKDGTRISAAGLNMGFTLAIDPSSVTDAELAYEGITDSVPLNREVYTEAVEKTTDPYEVLMRRISEKQGNAISDLEIDGVIVERERWRTYPSGDLAAQTIGFVAFDNDDTLAGRFGLERYYDDVLKRDSEGLFGNFFAELFSNIGNAVGDADSVREGDLLTSIEPVVQEKLHQILEEIDETYSSQETGGIIMIPETGEIIALETTPSFNLNTFASENSEHFGNPLVESRYEFGSIVKALTMASGLDAGVIAPSTTYNDLGKLTLNGKTISNFDGKARGVVPMQEILSQSLNTGVAFIAGELGHEKMRHYFEALGMGTETGIDLPSEISSTIDQIMDSPRDIEYATASYGQGIAQTPVGMIKALGALANNGKVVTPHIVKSIRLESGVTKDVALEKPKKVFEPESVEKATRMLVEVVDTALAKGKLKIPQMSVAAKTGTAQISDPQGGYKEHSYFHSFFGYFPAYQPRFIILLYTREPQGVQYASETLTHPFMDLTHFLIQYYALPPDRGSYDETDI